MSLSLTKIKPEYGSFKASCDLQCPVQVLMELGVHALHVSERNLLSKNHFVKGANEKGVQEAPVENRQAYDSTNEFEVVEMFGIDSGVRIYLKGVVVVRGVFEETVERIEHFVR